MRVPDDLSKAANLELGVEFKCKAIGTLTGTIAAAKLPVAKPPMQSFFKGMSEESLKTNPKAILDAFEKAFEHYPDETQLQISYAMVMLQIEDPKVRDLKKAITYAKKAAESKGGMRGFALSTLAMAYHKDGQLELAVETIKKARPLCGNRPEFSEAYESIMKDVEKSKKK